MKWKTILFPAAALLLAGLVGALLFWNIRRRTERAPIVPQDLTDRSMVALTFDDGPDARYTPRLLNVLYEQQVPATFFLVGQQIEGNERIVKEMLSSGHEIGGHTDSHANLNQLTEAQVRAELERMQAALDKALGRRMPVKYQRPPYGEYPAWMEEMAGLKLVLWTLDTRDWQEPQADVIYERVVQAARDGDVIVLHDNNPETVRAVERIIPALREKGFAFATLSQMEAAGYDVTL